MELEQILAAYSRVSSANKAMFAKLRVVLQQFHANGIDCILLKGTDLIPRLYGVLGLRGMVDADLLVHESDLPAIDHLLTQWGYRPQIDGNPAYVDPDNKLALDIITKVWYVDDQNVIWQRAVQRDFAGIPIKGLGASDLLLYLTAYNVVHRGYLSPSFARDIEFLVEKERVDWAFILKEARRRHLKIPLYHGLSYVSKSTRVSVPAYVVQDLIPSSRSERFSQFLFQRLVTEKQIAGLGHLLLFLTQPGLKKWRWLKDRFFPSEVFLKYRYGDKWNVHPLATRLFRPLSLLFRAVTLFTRIVRLLITGRA